MPGTEPANASGRLCTAAEVKAAVHEAEQRFERRLIAIERKHIEELRSLISTVERFGALNDDLRRSLDRLVTVQGWERRFDA